MEFRDRVQELVRVPASTLVPHPENWRTHTKEQSATLAGVLEEVGFADAVVARRLPDGRLQVLDGHLRQKDAGDAVIPVLVVDLDDDEARKFLVTHDPISALAGTDRDNLSRLLATVRTEDQAVVALLDQLAKGLPAIETTLTADQGLGQNPAERLVIFQRNTIKQITIYVPENVYAQVLVNLSVLMKEYDAEDHSAAVLRLIEEKCRATGTGQ